MTNTAKDSLNESFKLTLYDDSVREITQDYLEFGIDSLIDNELVRSIPIIKTLSGLYKFTKSVQEYYLTKKIVRFLFQIKNVTADEIFNTLKKLESDKSYRKDLGEHLLLLLDKFETIYKADLLGQTFKMYLKNQLSYEDFSRASHIIDKSFLNDLFKLKNLKSGSPIDLISKENLFSLGLLSLKPHEIKVGMTGGEMVKKLDEVDYKINDAGLLILRIIENE